MPESDQTGDRQRLDKWLWFARIVKTREAAAGLVESGHVRLNSVKVLKPGHSVKRGDVLTLVLNARVRVLHIEAMAVRRGPAETARMLYREPFAMPGGGTSDAEKEDATPDGNC